MSKSNLVVSTAVAGLMALSATQVSARSINQSRSVRSSTSVVNAHETVSRDHSAVTTGTSTGVAVDAYQAGANNFGASIGFNSGLTATKRSGGGSVDQSNGTDSSSSVVNAATIKATGHSVVAKGASTAGAFDFSDSSIRTIGIQAGFNSYSPAP